MRLKDKMAVITGAASGIGRAGVELFAREGAKIAAVDIDAARLDVVVDAVKRAGGDAVGIVADLSNIEDCKRLANEASEKLGGLDILWNHCGIPGPGSVENLDLEAYHKSIAINLTSGIVASGEALKHMRNRGGGSIIFTASIAGLVGSPFSPVYSAEKTGIVGLVRSLALRFAPDNVRVNALCPGLAETPMKIGFLTRPEDRSTAEENENSYVSLVPMGRLVQPGEVASAALFLASDESSFVTGIALAVDGGYTCR